MRTLPMLAKPVALAALALLCAGCFKPDEQKRAGVDDFPNSIYAQVNGFLGESRKSGEVGLVPAVTDSILTLQGFNVASAKAAAAKLAKLGAASKAAASDSGCAGDTLKFDTTFTVSGNTTVNSTTVCVDAKLLDSIKGNETVLHGSSTTTFPSGRVESADFSDADGDGILNPVAGRQSKARLILTTTEAGVVERTVLIVGPGPDNNFNTEADNVIYAADWIKTDSAGRDTLGTAAYADADSDGIVVDNGKPSLVDLDLYQKGPTKDHADALWSRVRLRFVARYGVGSKEAKRVHFEMETADGRLQSADLLDKNGNQDFDMRDTLKARFLAVGTAAADTIDTMETELTMKVGADLDDKSDDSVYAIDVRAEKKIGEEKSDHFSFVSDRPIPSGRKPQSGTLSMKVGYTDASTVEVDGRLSDKGLDVTLKNRDGKRFHVVWDPLGRGVSLEEIP